MPLCSWPERTKSVLEYLQNRESLDFYTSVLREDTATLKKQVKWVNDINIERESFNALQLACFVRNEEIVRILVNVPRIDVNASSSSYPPPLIIACLADEPKIVALLLAKGANVSITDLEYGGSPLMIACLNRSIQIALMILQNTPNGVLKRGCQDALLKPWEEDDNGTLAIAKILIENEEDMDAKNFALAKASELGHSQMGKLLLENGADVNFSNNGHGYSVLYLASQGGHVEFVRVLVEAGAEVKVKTPYDDHPLVAAVDVSFSYFEIAKILLEAGAGDEYCGKSNKKRALEACEKKNPAKLQELISDRLKWIKEQQSRYGRKEGDEYAAYEPSDAYFTEDA